MEAQLNSTMQDAGRISAASSWLQFPLEIRQQRIAALSPAEQLEVSYDWDFWARTNQKIPPGIWTYWLILAGRGFGKTRTGAEFVREKVKKYPLVNLIGATLDDARDIMIKGESGILAVCPKDERPKYVDRELRWPNGAVSLIFTADEPERLRGKQHMVLWCDELASWRYPESWDQAMFGLRLGDNPQACITTTPRPLKILKEIINDKATVISTGSTYENRDNLAPSFFDKIITKYEGTRLGRQELMAELLDDMPGALWNRKRIDELRVKEAPELCRSCVAIDPAVSTKEDSDETGIIVAGKTVANHGYILGDYSGVYTPQGWGEMAVRQFHAYKCDFIIAEANNGGDLVESNIRAVDPNVPVKLVHASKGKFVRAEPAAALAEQGRYHHVGNFDKLEDQMCGFTVDFDRKKAGYSPDRMDAMVWAIHELILLGFAGSNVMDYIADERQKAAAAKAQRQTA